METVKKSRTVHRRTFTRVLNSFLEISRKPNSSLQEKRIAMQLVESRMAELVEVSSKYVTMLFESECSEADIESEIVSHEEYQVQFLNIKFEHNNLTSESPNTAAGQVGQDSRISTRLEKPFKKPTLEIPKFAGNVGDWLQFWSHFRKVDEDHSVSEADKLEYLKQSVEKNSKADNVVSGYPTTAENYKKALESLKNRFGRDDLLVEFYTRELLNLVLQNAASHKVKVTVAQIYDKISAQIRALESLGVSTDKCATMLYPLVESSLPEEILRTWQRSLSLNSTAQDPDARSDNQLSKLLEFLRREDENEERIDMAVNGFGVFGETAKKEKWRGSRETTESSRDLPSASVLFSSENKHKRFVCIFCGNDHENVVCEKAKRMPYEERKNIVSKNKCCFKCLKRGHLGKDCKVKIVCSWCGRRHSIILCPSISNGNNIVSIPDSKIIPDDNKKLKEQNLANFCSLPEVYLQTVRVILFSNTKEIVVRAVIDTGSQRSYIRSDIAKFLEYKPIGNKEIIHSLFGGERTKSQLHNIYLVRVKSCQGSYACNFQVMDQDVICSDVPCIKEAGWIEELQQNGIYLCDFNPDSRIREESIEMLIGADIIGKLMTGKKYDCANGLTAFETLLGWTIIGRVTENNRNDLAITTLSMFANEAKVSDLWSLDVLGINDPIEKLNRLEKEKRVKENFLNTVVLNANSRYIVNLPWISNHEPISTNLNNARIRLSNVEKKLKAEGFFEEYNQVIQGWVDEGIVELVLDNEIENVAHYLPHRHVVKLESTTRIRPVFDASAREQGFPSLNQCLEKGPNLIELIPISLLRFRENEIAVMADIRKAFLQIEVNKCDRDFLRFLWFKNREIRVFRHKRVVFGLTCSPFLLGAVLELHFTRMLKATSEMLFNNGWSEKTILKLSKSFYVDNCTTSVNSIEELNTFIKDSREILSKGSFDLRNWEYTKDNAKNESTCVLGILYNKMRDTVAINPTLLNIPVDKAITKRLILSAANRAFDPIGFVCPVTLIPKLVLKGLWKLKKDWDAPVDAETGKAFLKWVKQLYYLKFVEIPRKFGKGHFSLHTFCDASKLAYAAVVFLRIEKLDGVEVRFIYAKTRLAPEKFTIPRLELMAACIGSRLTSEVVNAIDLTNVPMYYWTDATTVLAWLNRDMQWNTFICNRVREIRELTKLGTWRHVPGEMNPADLPSRGCDSKQLLESRWWEGPAWLRDSEDRWPKETMDVDENEVISELRKTAQVSMVMVNQQLSINILEQFSSYSKLIRFFAIFMRFKNFKVKKEMEKGPRITCKELYETELKFLKYLQGKMFASKADLKLATLQTFIYEDGLIRLKTKIVEREDSFPFLFPIVLDGNHDIVKLIIRETHENMCHAGVQIVMCQLREKCWILSMRKVVRSVISKCVKCKRFNSKRVEAGPAPLPIYRVRDANIFEIIGVDFAGPVFLRGQQKGWICLFTCAVYRAIHLELVTSLSTPAFLSCLRRFVSRRGRPTIVCSDNGTNFVGTNNAFKSLNWDYISKYCSAKEIQWRFNPSTTAWWGGWWERLVGLLKNILRKVLGRSCLTFEEMCTVLCDCESVLNSRPLTYLSESADDLKVLTPAMFLHQIKETGTPDIDVINKIDLSSKFKRKQEIVEHLRKRFRSEYLGQLASRCKSKKYGNVQVGDIVIIGDDNHKRIDWLLGKIEKLFVGRDGMVRVVELKTKSGKLKRPIQRIYPLEVTKMDSDEFENFNEKIRDKVLEDLPLPRKISDDLPNDSQTTTRYGRTVKRPDYF